MGWIEAIGGPSGRLLLWGIFSRAMAFVYLVAFLSHLVQAPAFISSRGVAPIRMQLDALRRDFGWLDRLWINPSLFWIWSSDGAVSTWLVVGVVSAALAMCGGPWTPACFVVCYAALRSYQYPMRLHYPWDASLLEAGVLAFFLPAALPLPALAISALPHPALIFAFHFLLFRILFSFGKEKFFGSEGRDTLYTRYFLVSIPNPTPIGWYVSRFPAPVHRVAFFFAAFAELLAPVLVLVPGIPRLVGVAGICGQMLLIQITSSFGFFNLLGLTLCIAALDHSAAPIAWMADAHAWRSGLPFSALVPIIVLGAVPHLLVNSWVSSGFLDWPAWRRLPRGPLAAFLAFMRWISPLRLVNAYGVFGPHPAPPVRWVPVFEGSNDGEHWRAWEWRYQMNDDFDGPTFVAPHHPRFEGVCFYEVYGVEALHYLSVMNFNLPHWFSPRSMLVDRMIQRLLEPPGPLHRIFRNNPFPQAPPRLVRLRLVRYRSASLAERRRSGRWWVSEPAGFIRPPTALDGDVWSRWLPQPELFHLEAVAWRRRSRSRPPVEADLDRLTAQLLPWIRAELQGLGAGDAPRWDAVPALALAARRRWSKDDLWGLRCALGRVTQAILRRLDPVFDRPATSFWRDVMIGRRRGEGAPLSTEVPAAEAAWQSLASWPDGPLRTRLRVGLLVYRLLLTQPRSAWEELTVPLSPHERRVAGASRSMSRAAAAVGLELDLISSTAAALTIENSFFLEAVVDYEVIARHAQRMRLLFLWERVITIPSTGVLPGAFELSRELARHPELRPIEGFGAAAMLLETPPLPRAEFGADGIWREPSGEPT